MKKFGLLLATLLMTSATVLAGCGTDKKTSSSAKASTSTTASITTSTSESLSTSSSSVPDVEYVPEHYYSKQVNFRQISKLSEEALEKKSFTGDDRYGYATLTTCTDGDTANFKTRQGENVTIRFLGIDTPESTASIQPWGKKASVRTCSLLKSAEKIILDAADLGVEKSKRMDSNGTRWLGLVWIFNAEYPDGYMINLDSIEESYSFFTGGFDSERYVTPAKDMTIDEMMFNAEIRAARDEQRKLGSKEDPDYDYRKTPEDHTLASIHSEFDRLASRATLVRTTGIITRFVGNHFYLQDNEGNAIYCYMGLSASNVTEYNFPGDKISVVGRLSVYGGVRQLTDIQYNAKDWKLVESGVAIPAPIELDPTKLEFNAMNSYVSKLVKITVMCRGTGSINLAGAYTVNTNATVKGENSKTYTFSIRINGTIFPIYETTEFVEGKTYTFIGPLSLYQYDEISDPQFQIAMANRSGVAVNDFKAV